MAMRKKSAKQQRREGRLGRIRGWLGRLVWRMLLTVCALGLVAVALYAVVAPPTTHTIWSERQRLGAVSREWVSIDAISPHMLRAAIAAEDANFCRHWGFDMRAIRAAMEDGAARGASTITQQTVKNAYLWQGRSWLRKAVEAALTPVVEALWTKRRVLEVYLNIAEFGEGVFGVEAAAVHWYGRSANMLTLAEASRLATLLPDPRRRDPTALSPRLRSRAAAIADGAATIARDGRDDCLGLTP